MTSILFIQNGDYRDAYQRFARGGPETYRDQRRSVDYVAGLTTRGKVTTAAYCQASYHEELAPGLWAIGMQRGNVSARQIRKIFDQANPTHVILRTPDRGFLREIRKRNLPLLPSFADIINPGGLRTRLTHVLLRRALLQCQTPCYSNHSLNASRSLVNVLGLPEDKVVPWDWSKVPFTFPAKTGAVNPETPTAFYAGVLSEHKGVGDCLAAVAVLKARGIRLTMRFAGPGDIGEWTARAEALGIADQVAFLGVVGNAEVREKMNAHDVVIVASRHSYPEGLPNTIYEALASRSVMVISDHPSFSGRLRPDEEAVVFEAQNPASLADGITMAVSDPALYKRVSANAEAAHDRLYIGLEWTELVETFLNDPLNETGWVTRNCLSVLDP
ncbi:MAG: glycosyltransferase family 4 protein [Paracoccaceae bacterium]|jgi:glycosyltransferase involved in cell wall biosynthesis|nr:glycosyltransferase family 4 protein [Paracoccaceae bacterium]MDP7186097.1 glycosyltransferase family 4 protein [Paracoccaceae bacterium]